MERPPTVSDTRRSLLLLGYKSHTTVSLLLTFSVVMSR